MTCPYGHRECGGIADLWFGDLPCWECFRDYNWPDWLPAEVRLDD